MALGRIAFVHQFWMWHWRDSQLFTDALTAELRGSARYPDGYKALIGSYPARQPDRVRRWLGVALMAASGWLVFAIVREHSSWRPAAWIAAALFLALIDIHRFYGGFPRLRASRRATNRAAGDASQRRAAALVAAGGALLLNRRRRCWRPGSCSSSRSGWSRRRPARAADVVRSRCSQASSPPSSGRRWLPRAPTYSRRTRRAGAPEFGPNGALNFFVRRRSATSSRTAADSTSAARDHPRARGPRTTALAPATSA